MNLNPLLTYVKTATNKRLLISESRGNSNRCTHCRRKPEQHATHFSNSVRIWPSIIRISRGPHISTFCEVANIFEQIHCYWEGLSTQPRPGWVICGSVPSFYLEPTIDTVGKSQASVDNRLLGLSDPYHRHAIGTFNICSRKPTHRSLTDPGGGYNLEGVDFPHTTPHPYQSTIFTFHLRAPPGLRLSIQQLPTELKRSKP
jgi:hypothetical protein